MKTPTIDPIAMAILWNSFVSIAEESGAVIERTAHSQVVREAADFSSAIFDAKGRMLGQGAHSVGHLGSMNRALEVIVERFPPPALEPEDVIVFNDPAIGAGHLPDIYVVSPIFFRDQLVGYAANTAHHADVGGMTPGSQAITGVTDLVQEGLFIPPVHLYRRGRRSTDIMSIIEGNSRARDFLRGDLEAQVIGLRTAERRFASLLEAYGKRAVDQAASSLLRWSEAEMRRGISALPDGRYHATDYLDGYGPDTNPIKVAVAVEIRGSRATIDFTGTDPQVPAGMNSYFNFTFSYAYFALKCVVGSSTPQNHGCLRPVKVLAPSGSIVNPLPGAACGGRAVMNYRLFEVVLQALAQAAPDRVVAPGPQAFNLTFGGTDPSSGRQFVCYQLLLGSFGGRATGDAPDGLTSISNSANVPVELIEAAYPFLIERFEFIPDAVGAGRHRSSYPTRRDYRILADNVTFTNGSDRHKFPPPGLRGGCDGTVAQTILNPGTGEVILDSKGNYALRKGDLLSIRLAGGGAYEPPEERSVEAIASDVADGLLTMEQARVSYPHAFSAENSWDASVANTDGPVASVEGFENE